MAVVDISEPTKFRRFLAGASTDVKPTGDEYLGAFFVETDTGKVFLNHDGTNWIQIVT